MIDETLKKIELKMEALIPLMEDKWPHCCGVEGVYEDADPDFWTSGFWPGMLWIMYGLTGKERFKKAAWGRDEQLEIRFKEELHDFHHDVGFQFLPTAVIKYKMTGNLDGRRRGIEAADFLADRFNHQGKFIRAWNKGPLGNEAPGWSIIDCMLNIPLLFWASEETGEPRYRDIAIQHAETTMKYGIRNDGSVCHIISFDPETGAYIESIGGQGRSPDSSWSRGMAWALYGFSRLYQETKDKRYLEVSKKVAHYFIAALPDDNVPYWDLRVDRPVQEPRDSSAGAIAASGLIDLAKQVDQTESWLYDHAAKRILTSLTEQYSTWDQPDHEALLLRATGNRPMNHCVEGSFIFGDYFYLEALAKRIGWKERIF